MYPSPNSDAQVFGDASPAPVATASGSLTYEPFYGLREKPFSLSADPRFLFRSSAHGPAFDELQAGIRRREGLIVLTGEIGTGKTTLCRSVLQHLDRRTFAAFVADPFVSREDLLKTLLVDFGVISIGGSDARPFQRRVALGSELSALRVPRFAGAAAGLCRRRHRRSAEPVAAAARGDSHPLGAGAPREAAPGRARRPARAAIEPQAAGDAAGGPARLGPLRADARSTPPASPDT